MKEILAFILIVIGIVLLAFFACNFLASSVGGQTATNPPWFGYILNPVTREWTWTTLTFDNSFQFRVVYQPVTPCVPGPVPCPVPRATAKLSVVTQPAPVPTGASPYVGGPTGAITVNTGVTPREVDIATVVLPRKGASDTINGVWTFTPGFMLGAGTEPACNASTRGRIVMVRGGSGIADTVRVCRKNASGAYEWREF